MALKNISTVVELNSPWAKIDLGDLNSFYVIGIKEEKGSSDTIDSKDVKILNFEIGIESGIQDTYLTTGYITLNFEEFTSTDSNINKLTAMTRCLNYPSIFYIRPTDIITYNGEKITKGITSVNVNINSIKLK